MRGEENELWVVALNVQAHYNVPFTTTEILDPPPLLISLVVIQCGLEKLLGFSADVLDL